jgi:NAD(P)-dependent dehydrogenase (short-subunit alcohol dehydrogenase family)
MLDVHGMTDEQFTLLARRIPAGRLADPADVAGPAVFLASDAARYVTGTTLTAGGGTTSCATATSGSSRTSSDGDL